MELTQGDSKLKLPLFEKFLTELANDTSCDQILVKRKGKVTDVGLINIYRDRKLIENLPTIWTDWWGRLNSRVMIFGQDWGPEIEMRKLHEQYLSSAEQEIDSNIAHERGVARSLFLNDFKKQGRTTTDLVRYLRESALSQNIDLSDDFIHKIYATMAVMFARRGKYYRGNGNFDNSISLGNNIKHMRSQIEIIRPDVVLTLGGLALKGLSVIGDFEFDGRLANFINSFSPGSLQIDVDGRKIEVIPLYHPAAYIAPSIQLEQYKKFWWLMKQF